MLDGGSGHGYTCGGIQSVNRKRAHGLDMCKSVEGVERVIRKTKTLFLRVGVSELPEGIEKVITEVIKWEGEKETL